VVDPRGESNGLLEMSSATMLPARTNSTHQPRVWADCISSLTKPKILVNVQNSFAIILL
jgi:hypothetical protein